jgi:hypothetical protein
MNTTTDISCLKELMSKTQVLSRVTGSVNTLINLPRHIATLQHSICSLQHSSPITLLQAPVAAVATPRPAVMHTANLLQSYSGGHSKRVRHISRHLQAKRFKADENR